ncbi:uncharacterized protein LOC110842299 [Folsomia candida]|uniref:Uncharacterized protein n=1 Tax=Folsomia candida TaxID=158441 RepID=A0A226EXX1_FOLCA|nr:uncharacterized protein LOC110842299 [Folsomia candida]OXA61681.1 hypothetical protein Fcan01_02112 [Folsomia candida]
MIQCRWCQCSRRTVVMLIALISVVHFILESVAVILVGEEHRTMISSTAPYFYTMVAAQIFTILVSILLGIGAYSQIFWFCIPWLFTTFLNLMYHCYILIVLLIKMMVLFDMIQPFKGIVIHYQNKHEGQEEEVDEKSEDHGEEQSEDHPPRKRKC